jgi:energy-coupling factor transporter transmembrane protein EcfT
LKKLLTAIIVVSAYNHIITLLALLIIINIIFSVYKIYERAYNYRFKLYLTGLADVLYVIVLALKINDFKNYLKLFDFDEEGNLIEENILRWNKGGWITASFELCCVTLYIISGIIV